MSDTPDYTDLLTRLDYVKASSLPWRVHDKSVYAVEVASALRDLSARLAECEAECERFRSSRGGPTMEQIEDAAHRASAKLDSCTMTTIAMYQVIRDTFAPLAQPSENPGELPTLVPLDVEAVIADLRERFGVLALSERSEVALRAALAKYGVPSEQITAGGEVGEPVQSNSATAAGSPVVSADESPAPPAAYKYCACGHAERDHSNSRGKSHAICFCGCKKFRYASTEPSALPMDRPDGSGVAHYAEPTLLTYCPTCQSATMHVSRNRVLHCQQCSRLAQPTPADGPRWPVEGARFLGRYASKNGEDMDLWDCGARWAATSAWSVLNLPTGKHEIPKDSCNNDSVWAEARSRASQAQPACQRCARCEAEELHAQLLEARAVIERLPKTADGVPVFPGMRVYDTLDGGVVERYVTRVARSVVYVAPIIGLPPEVELDYCYSTRNAAEAARQGEGE